MTMQSTGQAGTHSSQPVQRSSITTCISFDAPMIASLSLGGTRRFLLKEATGDRHAIDLASGDLLLMSGDSQRRYRHALPRTAKPVAPRINLTFRRVLPVAG